MHHGPNNDETHYLKDLQMKEPENKKKEVIDTVPNAGYCCHCCSVSIDFTPLRSLYFLSFFLQVVRNGNIAIFSR